jgi:membrane-anchored protein YejM (alkaline phosphatase superfamily)
MGAAKAASRLKNSYLNSLHYVDRQIARVVRRLQESGELDQTVILVAGDHGEEFAECGHFAHTGSFNKYELQTLCVLRLPGEAPAEIKKTTSHLDLMPTILAWMGVTNAPEDYSCGFPIQGSKTSPYLVVGDLEKRIGVIKSNVVTVLTPQGVYNQTLDCERPVSADDPGFISRGELLQIVAQNQRFFVPEKEKGGRP